jgi:diguanylate cyclase (GGDEF)-like protein
MGWGKAFCWAAIVVFALSWCGTAQGEVRAAICIARDNGMATPVQMIAAPARFDCRTPQTRWGPGDYWAVSQALPPALGTQPTLVRSFSMWEDHADNWALYADGHVLPVPVARNVVTIGTAVEHAIPARGVPVVRLLWRVRGAQNVRGIVMGVRLVTVRDHAANSLALGMKAGLMAGLCVAFLFFALALWVAIRRTFLLAYCAMVASLLLYLLADAGLFLQLLPGIDRLTALRISGFGFTLCVVSGLWFSRAFLDRDAFGERAGRTAALAVLAVSFAKEALAPWRMILFDQIVGVALIIALATLCYVAFRARTTPRGVRWLWPVTAIVPALLIMLRVANTFPLLARPFAMGPSLMVFMASGMFLSALAIAYRVHRLSRERDEAREGEIAARLLADTDPLTGLLNRRAFLAQAIGRPGEQMLLLTDLDHFKLVNETIGHDGGDEVLRVFARALQEKAPPGALIARIGGEEFAIVAAADSGLSPRAMHDALRQVRMPYDMAVTTSIGVCTGPLLREIDWKSLYRRADRALYAAKAAGRDRVRDAKALPLAA